jgi:hypothetical protein
MTTLQLIEKLKTFPTSEQAKFYCPVNKTYYYPYMVSNNNCSVRIWIRDEMSRLTYGRLIAILSKFENDRALTIECKDAGPTNYYEIKRTL